MLLDLKSGYVFLLRAINLANYSRCNQPLTCITPSPPTAGGGGGGKSFSWWRAWNHCQLCSILQHTPSQMFYSHALASYYFRGCSYSNVWLRGIYSSLITALCIFWRFLATQMVLHLQVSSGPWANLVLNIFACSVSPLWFLKWMRSSGLFSHSLLPGSCKCPEAVWQGRRSVSQEWYRWAEVFLFFMDC